MIQITSDIDTSDLIICLKDQLARDEIVQFIKDLELALEDTGILISLRDHFAQEAKKEDV